MPLEKHESPFFGHCGLSTEHLCQAAMRRIAVSQRHRRTNASFSVSECEHPTGSMSSTGTILTTCSQFAFLSVTETEGHHCPDANLY